LLKYLPLSDRLKPIINEGLKANIIGLKSDYEDYNYYAGTPKGCIISPTPTLANLTLNGLENAVFKYVRNLTTSRLERYKRLRGSRVRIY
jgi:hypothetical protein